MYIVNGLVTYTEEELAEALTNYENFMSFYYSILDKVILSFNRDLTRQIEQYKKNNSDAF